MKKHVFLALSAFVMCGCGNTEFVLGTHCKKIAQGHGDNYVVQCPKTDELKKIQTRTTPDSMFIDGLDYYDLNTYAQDTEHVYVEIIPNGCKNIKLPIVRVMTENPVIDGKTFYAYSVKPVDMENDKVIECEE